MAIPSQTKYLIIGAGVHGLSTAYHLASELQGARQGQRQGHPGRRQDRDRRRRVGHRLRRHPQQLLPAGDARADGRMRRRLGERRQGVQLPRRRLHADQPRVHARGRRPDREPAEGRSATLAFHRRRGRLHEVHEAASSTTGRPRASPPCCTRRRAATPTTRASMHGLAGKAEAEGVRILDRRQGDWLRARQRARARSPRS